jgi:hypothetical protein
MRESAPILEKLSALISTPFGTKDAAAAVAAVVLWTLPISADQRLSLAGSARQLGHRMRGPDGPGGPAAVKAP